jgi:hypothetical protein
MFDPVSIGVMGGLSLAQGVFGALGASSQAKAQAMAAEIQQRNANFQAQWQKEAQDRNTMRQFQANLERNIQIEKAANKERAMAELYLDKTFSNQKSTLSKQTAQVNAQFLAATTRRGMNPTSGTARALFRQNIESLGNNMVALKLNHRSAYQDIVTQQQARLAQRASSISPDLGVFIPAKGGIPDNSSAALTTGLIQAGLQGVATGVNTYLKYGQQPNPSQGGGNSSSPMPFSERAGGGDTMGSGYSGPYSGRGGNSLPAYTGMGSASFSDIQTFQF